MGIKGDNIKVFIDTNILIYASLEKSPFYRSANDAMRKLETGNADLFINRQVLREYLASMTRPGILTRELKLESIIQAINNFQEDFTVLNEGAKITRKLLALAEKISVSGKQIHDANIVATMMVNGVSELLTHNVSDFERFCPEIKLRTLSPL